ncbi:MAG TPA: hypothetical protein VMK12_24370 [Anaeromyxobacteraceae bacterium]|nr:hypothetical protein [Anaeromyxobacteraceae bacterium]
MTEQGVLMTTVVWGANLTEKAIGVPLGAVRAIRDEAFHATFAGVDFAEAVSLSSFKILRETLQRVDKLSQEMVDGLDLVAASVTRVIRGSGEAAGEMVLKTTASITGTRETTPKAAAMASA